jgi:hypothetical protein
MHECAQDRVTDDPTACTHGHPAHDAVTNAWSKKADNHAEMMSIYFMHYNFVRIHQTLKIKPAMAAGLTKNLWERSDMMTQSIKVEDQ